jgi:hypothetical protein
MGLNKPLYPDGLLIVEGEILRPHRPKVTPVGFQVQRAITASSAGQMVGELVAANVWVRGTTSYHWDFGGGR